MVRAFRPALVLLAALLPAVAAEAALAPHAQRAIEIQAIRDSSAVARKLRGAPIGSVEPIAESSEAPSYRVTTERCVLIVDTITLPRTDPGPRRFKLKPRSPLCH